MAETSHAIPDEVVFALSTRREQQLHDLRFLETLQETLTGCRDVAAVYSSAVHRVAAAFDVDACAVAAYEPIGGTLEILHAAGSRADWDTALLLRAVHEQRTFTAGGMLAAPIVPSAATATREAGRVWGVLAVTRTDRIGPAYAPAERHTLRGAAARIAVELERRRVEQLDDVLDTLLRKTKPIDVYSHALRELRRFIRYDHSASIITMQRGMAQLTVRVEKIVAERRIDADTRRESLEDSPRRGRVVRLTMPQMQFLTELKQPLHLVRDSDSPEHLSAAVDGDPIAEPSAEEIGLWRAFSLGTADEAAMLCYPLIFGGQTLGILRLASRRPAAFQPVEQHVQLLDRLARLLAVTLYRSELYHQSDRQLQAIKQIGRSITEPIPVDEVCRQVLQLALRVLHVQVGSIGLLSEDGRLELAAQQGCTLAEPPILRHGEGIAGAAVKAGRSRAVPDVSQEPAYVVFNSRVCSELVAPIMYNREVIGFLDVESFELGRFREEDEEVITFLEALANQAAIAIKTAQLHREAVERLGAAMAIDPSLSMAGLQDLLVEELRDKIDKLAASNERLAAANQAKSDFVAQMSHDLRGPLNVIVGLSSLLTDPTIELSDEKRRESLQIIRSSGELLGSLIGTILDLSRLEAGKVPLAMSTFEATAAFRYLQSSARTLAAESGRQLEIAVSLDPALTTITADEEKFLRIFQNLLSNAVKFTPDGGRIRLTATIEGSAADDTHRMLLDGDRILHIAVSDTGIGIAPEHQERVFQPFQQVGTPVGGREGTGLGLAVVQRLVELHGGHVWLESAPGEGSIFHVLLPGTLVAAVQPPAAPSTGSGAAGTGEVVSPPDRKLILVVEDSTDHMNLMRLAITSRGYRMHGVATGEDALEWLDGNRPDAVVLDLQLPGIDGFAVAAAIKNRVETQDIPVIIVTADALSMSEERARASGCDAYLTKPIDVAALMTTIETVTP
ncbi:MAG TPA: ATP-binding protein [Chloroflexota bacterium]|nr:ATP-binding protein [Chloroflexota bacterium]